MFAWASACSGVHFLLSMYSLCRVLSTGGTYWLGHFVVMLVFILILHKLVYNICVYIYHLNVVVFIAEKLWSGLENFVFDWLINADR